MVEESYNNSDTELKQGLNQKKVKLNETLEIVDGKKCKRTYRIGTSTGNCAVHLANNHGITEQVKQEVNTNSESSRTPIPTEKTAKYLRHVIADVSTPNLAEKVDQDSKKDSQQLSKIMLTNDELDLPRDLIPILGPFEKKPDILEPESESKSR
ncbi:7681_t:CDS:2 [Funneliformis geosporum]|uniref:7681_t:CDS:1 n=1 Tax=Funneliformis geosporum TaxID=1117311 RepID=A0A9W4T3T1_9GLOM|nr:7681_t:CDS:2 [Funneliformis geosporum]